jgi:hypothetical protein
MSSLNIGEVIIFLIGVEVVPEMQHFLHWNVLRKHWRKASSFKTVEKALEMQSFPLWNFILLD